MKKCILMSMICVVGFLHTVWSQNEDDSYQDYVYRQNLPDWFLKSRLLDEMVFQENYSFDVRLNPLYLEEDFNNDGILDIVIPIQHLESNKVGFAIIHGGTYDVHIVGAGKRIKNSLGDDMGYINIWKVNRERENQGGLNSDGSENNTPLILDHPSIQIEKSEVGGGLIYWNGSEYVYFHQTC